MSRNQSRENDKRDDAQRRAIAELIGWQLWNSVEATYIELEQWEKCVAWARNDKRPETKPCVPKRVCIPYTRMNNMRRKDLESDE